MSELASIEKLRGYFTGDGMRHGLIHALIDDVEQEISEQFIKLPVGDDGMPIHVGDCCEMNDERFEVRQLKTDGDYWWAIDRLGRPLLTMFCHHVKPRTIEDVLCDYEDHILTLKEAAAELRGMMKADE